MVYWWFLTKKKEVNLEIQRIEKNFDRAEIQP